MDKPFSNCRVHGYTEDVGWNGTSYICRSCRNAYHKKWRADHPEYCKLKVKQRREKYQNDPENRKKHSLYMAKRNAPIKAKKKRLKAEKWKTRAAQPPSHNCPRHGYTENVTPMRLHSSGLFMRYKCKICNNNAAKKMREKKKWLPAQDLNLEHPT